MANLTHTAPQARDFSATTRRALLVAKVAIIGVQAVAAFEGDASFTGMAYAVSDNGTHRLLTHREVLARAAVSSLPSGRSL